MLLTVCMGFPTGIKDPTGMGMGIIVSPWTGMGTGTDMVRCRGDEDGSPIPAWVIPIASLTHAAWLPVAYSGSARSATVRDARARSISAWK